MHLAKTFIIGSENYINNKKVIHVEISFKEMTL